MMVELFVKQEDGKYVMMKVGLTVLLTVVCADGSNVARNTGV